LADGREKSDWYASSYANMAIGYELKINPLQILTLYNAVANNGKMLNPMFVDSIVKNGKTIEKKLPKVLVENICSRTTLDVIQKMLVGVVDNGTAKAIKSEYYKIAGKTGTAQTNYSSRSGNESMKYYCSFAGYFPADNPRYTVFVGIYHPERGPKSGSAVAAPVFKEIADRIITTEPNYYSFFNNEKRIIPPAHKGSIDEINFIYKYFNISTNYDEIGAGEWGYTNIINENVRYKTVNYDRLTIVPDLTGMCISDAVALLENAGLTVEISGFGVVVSQSIEKGERIIKGNTIKLKLGIRN
jgi:cell division protein FtsI (penicillin-binding protein 3)